MRRRFLCATGWRRSCRCEVWPWGYSTIQYVNFDPARSCTAYDIHRYYEYNIYTCTCLRTYDTQAVGRIGNTRMLQRRMRASCGLGSMYARSALLCAKRGWGRPRRRPLATGGATSYVSCVARVLDPMIGFKCASSSLRNTVVIIIAAAQRVGGCVLPGSLGVLTYCMCMHK